jgi:Zn ribbon nucleic-acid-binding protein
MPAGRISKPPSSTDRRKRLAARIEQLGFPAMAPCPQCEESGAVCIIQKNSTRCSSCVRKNVKCGGQFSDAEFDVLESQKNELLLKKMEARKRLTALAWELLAAQKEQDLLDQKLSKIHHRQEQMIEQEARALEELDTFESLDTSVPLAMLSDMDFSLGDELLSWDAEVRLSPAEKPSDPSGIGDGGGTAGSG